MTEDQNVSRKGRHPLVVTVSFSLAWLVSAAVVRMLERHGLVDTSVPIPHLPYIAIGWLVSFLILNEVGHYLWHNYKV